VEALQAAVDEKKRSLRAKASQPSQRLRTTLQRRPTRDRRKSIFRRRRLATSGSMPSKIACHFTMAELATLTVVSREIKRQKSRRCTLPIAQIAALGGTCRTTVQSALHLARQLRLVTVTERPRRGRKSDTNLIEIVSSAWKTWLHLGNRVQESRYHVIPDSYKADDSAKNGCHQLPLSYTSSLMAFDSAKSSKTKFQKERESMNFE